MPAKDTLGRHEAAQVGEAGQCRLQRVVAKEKASRANQRSLEGHIQSLGMRLPTLTEYITPNS